MEKRELLRDQIFKFFKKETNNFIEEPLKSIIPKQKIYLENLKIKEIDDDEPDLLKNIKGKPIYTKSWEHYNSCL